VDVGHRRDRAAAVVVALVAVYSDRWFRRSDRLASLLARFEAGEFHACS
jgi:hypothetical protein